MFNKKIVLLVPFMSALFVCGCSTTTPTSTEFDTRNLNGELIQGLKKILDFSWLEYLLQSNVVNKFTHGNETDNVPTVDRQCFIDFRYLLSSIQDEWAMKMLDSFGKPESGIFYGTLSWPGSYEECVDALAPPAENTTGFKGQYCWLTWAPQIETLKLPKLLPKDLSSAVCIPSSCQENDLRTAYNYIISVLENVSFASKLNETLPLKKVRCVPDTVKWSSSAIAYATFLAALFAIVLLATGYELFLKRARENRAQSDVLRCEDLSANGTTVKTNKPVSDSEECMVPSKPKRKDVFLLCFSAVENGSSILDLNSREGQLDCLHGIRFLSMAWIILGHSYIGGNPNQMSNIVSLVKDMDSFAFRAVMQASFSVDTFFLLSGFLLAYNFLKDGVKKMWVKEWVSFYLHRYLRLTPTLAFVIGIWTTIWLYVGRGPFWEYSGGVDQQNCQTKWWHDLLYINNFKDYETRCMDWSWYLANDMQFFAISPLFLVLLQRWPLAGYAVISATLLISWIATGVISYGNNFLVFGVDTEVAGHKKFINEIYIKPYTRIAPYLIGILLASAYIKCRKQTRFMKKWVVMLFWTVGTALSLVAIFGDYKATMGVLATAFYNALSRSAFALGVGWIIFACLTGHGGPVNWFLSWKVWFPLSRLTYCAYLIHFLIIVWYFRNLTNLYHLSHYTSVLTYLAILVLSYAGAFVTSVTLEYPFIALEKQLLRKQ